MTWECYDGLSYLVSLDGIKVNLNYRPAFFPDEGLYRAVADGDDETYMVEWHGTAERCDWQTPCRIVTLDEYNAESVGNPQCHVSPIAAETDKMPTEPAIVERGAMVQAESAPEPALAADRVPDVKSALDEMIHCSASLPDVLIGSTLAVAKRENGETVGGAILAIKKRAYI